MTELKRASVSRPVSSHINQRLCERELEGRDGRRGAEVNGGAADEDGEGHGEFAHKQRAVTCSFLPGHLLGFYLFFSGCNMTHLYAHWRRSGDTPGHRGSHGAVFSVNTSAPCSLSLYLFYSSFCPPLHSLSPTLAPPLCLLPLCQPPTLL